MRGVTTMVTSEHRKRIFAELKMAGMTSYGSVKMETNKLPSYIHEQDSLQTVQISGIAEKEHNAEIIAEVFRSISTPKNYEEGNHFPPIVSIKKGDYVIIRVSPTTIQYHDFSKSSC